MPPPTPSRTDRTRRLGLAAAAATAVMLVAGLLILMVVNPTQPAAPPRPSEALDSEAVVDLDDPGIVTEGGLVQLTDPDDPESVQAEVRYESIDPVATGRYEVTEPAAWIFLDDGRRAHVRAAAGAVTMIGEDRPQVDSGTLIGGVRILLFPAAAEPDETDPDPSLADLRADVETLGFDLTTGEMTTDDLLRITTASVDFEGRGVRALFSEVRQRLELLTVQRDGSITLRPGDFASSDDGAPQQPAATPEESPTQRPAVAQSPSTAPTPAQDDEPTETRYRASFENNVVVRQGGRTVDADLLEVWARLIDGRLPQNAAGTSAVRTQPAMPIWSALPIAALAQAGAEPGQEADTNALPVNLTWSGLLEVRPLADAPEPAPQELESDHLFARMTAERTGRVKLASSGEGVNGRASAIEYGLTSRRASLLGEGPGAVEFQGDGMGRLTAGRIDADLATGVAVIPGSGLLETAPDDEENAGRISWSDQADFVVAGIDGDDPQLRTAIFSGSVEAASGRADAPATIRASTLRAEFDPEASVLAGAPVIARAITTGATNASDGRGGKIAAGEALDVVFRTDGEDPRRPEPQTVTARGQVKVERGGESLSCGLLEVELEQTAEGPRVVDLFADEGAALIAEDGVRAEAITLHARPEDRTAELTGEGSRVQQGETVITGADIVLDGVRNSVKVASAGSFDHDPAVGASINATWLGGMFFDDTSGDLVCEGGVNALAESVDAAGGRTSDRVTAERFTAKLEPRTEPSEGADPGDPLTPVGRDLLTVLAEGGEGSRAKIESRRYAPGESGRVARLAYIEGDRIDADNTAKTLRVPGPGRLLISDREADGGQGEGDTLLDWDGSLLLEESGGRGEARRGVRLTHRRLTDGELSDLECERLDVVIDEAASAGAEMGPGAGRLKSADASGAVYLRSGSRELIADRLLYDAVEGKARAAALEGGRVTLFDPNSVSPTTAEAILWDLTTDRIDLIDPGSMLAPR